jgi:hypothetical protein
MPTIPDLSPEQFEALMEEIDAELNAQQSGTRGRELRGWMLFCQKLKLEGMPLKHPTSDRVMDWFKKRYGDRLNIDGSFGYSALVLRNATVRFRCALFWGRAILFCAPEEMHVGPPPLVPNTPARMNILRQFEGITQDFALSLNADEQKMMLETYVASEISLAWIGDIPSAQYVQEARGDIAASVVQLMMQSPQFGPSKWSSLQAVEKFLKAFIVQKGGKHELSHDVFKLSKQAVGLGLIKLSQPLLTAVQCAAAVRYDSISVSRRDAVDAHHASLSLCAEIAKQMPTGSEWNTKVSSRGEIQIGSKKFNAIEIGRTKVV